MDRFSYLPIEANPSYADRSRTIWRPMVPIAIRGLTGRHDAHGLVDTGAVETVLPMAFWEVVEPAHREGEEGVLASATGVPFPVRYGTVDLGIKLGRRRIWWSALVGFSEVRNDAVLGDAGFLRHFAVAFNRPKKFLTIRLEGRLPPAIMPGR